MSSSSREKSSYNLIKNFLIIDKVYEIPLFFSPLFIFSSILILIKQGNLAIYGMLMIQSKKIK